MHRAAISTAIVLWMMPIPCLWSQTKTLLEWRVDQQPKHATCTADDIAFASAPEQIALQKSYNVPQFIVATGKNLPPDFRMTCDSIQAATFNGARVLIIGRPSILDDGVSYALIQPKNSQYVRLIPIISGALPVPGSANNPHSLAAMNAMLQSSPIPDVQKIDWLAICMAYLTSVAEAPSLLDRHYDPEPNEHFKSYTVPGLLSELPSLRKKKLLPSLKCGDTGSIMSCDVDFYYRTEPVEPLEHASFEFMLEDHLLSLRQVTIVDFEKQGSEKAHRN
jgi:hypothetical protein